MNTKSTFKATGNKPIVSVATARLHLKNALKMEAQKSKVEDPDLLHKRALNDLTGASIFIPSKVHVKTPVDPAKVISSQIKKAQEFLDNQP